VARIGRMAVHRAVRGSGVGRRVLEALLSQAKARGDHEVMLHAQRSAEEFYLGMGFVPRGGPFEEAGIVHIEMNRAIDAC
jgi:predicted GNAT family N-acyltransferase